MHKHEEKKKKDFECFCHETCLTRFYLKFCCVEQFAAGIFSLRHPLTHREVKGEMRQPLCLLSVTVPALIKWPGAARTAQHRPALLCCSLTNTFLSQTRGCGETSRSGAEVGSATLVILLATPGCHPQITHKWVRILDFVCAFRIC